MTRELIEARREFLKALAEEPARGPIAARVQRIHLASLQRRYATLRAQQNGSTRRWIAMGRPQYWLGRRS